MKKDIRWRNLFFLALIASLLLPGGCGSSKPYRFYTLNPATQTSSSTTVQETLPAGPPSNIGIISVEIPDYLDRPQIVTRTMTNELKLAEFDRWAGDLQQDIARALAETMSSRLADNGVFILTGRRPVPAEYRIAVRIDRFEAMPGNQVLLKGLWTVLEKDGRRVLIRGESNISETAQGTDYGATVAAMSRTVDRLGTEIADAMRPTLARAAGTRPGGEAWRQLPGTATAPVADRTGGNAG